MQHASYIMVASVVKFSSQIELGSVAGPVIQANGRLTFEDDLRSGGLAILHYTVNQLLH